MQAMAGGGKRKSRGGKPTGKALLHEQHHLGVLARMCLWLDFMVI